MKKYTFNCDTANGNGCGMNVEGTREWARTYEVEWVKADLAEEMLADFHSVLTYVQAHYPQNLTLINMIQNAIRKAEEA